MDGLEIIGSATGILGALIMATKIQTHSHWAWSLWLISSISLTMMALSKEMMPLALMQIVFTVINLIGLKNSIKLIKNKELIIEKF